MQRLEELTDIEYERQEAEWRDWEATSAELRNSGLIKAPEPRRTREQIGASIVNAQQSSNWRPKGWMHKAGYGS